MAGKAQGPAPRFVSVSLPWRFSADSLSLEERFGYARDVWPQAAEFVGLRPGMRVLDVGCGTGSFTRFVAASVGAEGEAVGLDHDEALLARAREAGAPAGARLRYEQGSAAKLPFPDASFDVVASSFLLCVVPEPLLLLREMRRVARPGGLVASLSCFCKSGIFPTFAGLHDFEGAQRLEEMRRRFMDARRVHVRNPALGLPNGRDLDVWGDYHRAGLEELRIRGFLTVFAPSDARWTDAQAREYVEGRRRIELEMLDGLTPAQRDTLARHGFPQEEQEELRALLDRKHAWLLADDARIRRGMELLCDPAVLIVGRVP